MPSKHVVIVGGSVTGLGAALALTARGHQVTILEKDATPLPASPLEAFENWDRRGSPQTLHSHAFLGRLYGMIRDREPALLEKLIEHGVDLITFEKMIRPRFPDAELEPGDEDMTLIACRRVTFEWVLRRYILDTGLVDFRDGIEVSGLLTRELSEGIPQVRGVRLRAADGIEQELEADLVVDASGRRSKLGRWLEDIGAKRMREESSPCGIFYSSRFYKLRDGVETPVVEGGAMGADLGYLKYGIFPGDARIFSITLAASPEDAPMRAVLRAEAFERAAAAIPATGPWVDPAVSEPMGEVHGMGNLKNTRRFLVEDGEPLALGVVAIGDALIHGNPITGRGCTLAWVGAYLLADALDKHSDDPRALALELDAQITRELVPWYLAQCRQDADAIDVNKAQQRGEDPFKVEAEGGSVNPRAYMRTLLRDGLLPALRDDIYVLRAFMRAFNLLEAPQDLMGRADIMQRVMAVYAQREKREAIVLGPDRAEMQAILSNAAA